jgi:hypothetical protein
LANPIRYSPAREEYLQRLEEELDRLGDLVERLVHGTDVGDMAKALEALRAWVDAAR